MSSETQTSVVFISSQYDDMIKQSTADKTKLNDCTTKLRDIKAENDKLSQTLTELQNINKSMKEDLVDLKCRSLRDNLVFTNIPENMQCVDGRTFENTEEELVKFLHNKLQIDDVRFERVHRTMNRDRPCDTGPRPIIAKFSTFKD